MIRCIIIDDEPLACQLIDSYIGKLEDVEVFAIFNNPLSALPLLEKEAIDLIFLDIQMPEIQGTQFAKLLDPNVKVIFTTAYSDFAVEGFELKALDYLVKPISFTRFLDAVNRMKVLSEGKKESNDTADNFLFVKSEYRLVKIATSDILFFQGMGDYCSIVCKDKRVLTLEKLKSFEEKLPSRQFLRVHKSFIIAIDKIEYIEKKRVKINDQLIPIGTTYEDEVKKVLHIG